MIQITMSDKLHRTAFLGQEFLTWLLFRSFMGGVITGDDDTYGISISKAIVLDGQNPARERTSIKVDEPTQSGEVMLSLKLGKKVSKIRALFVIDGGEFEVVLNSEDLHPRSLRVPETRGADFMDVIDERFELMDKFNDALADIFCTFIRLRVNERAWTIEAAEIEEWITADEVA